MAGFNNKWVCVGNGLYAGLSANVATLPTDVSTYTKAKCIDTGAVYIFEESTATWYLQPAGSGTDQGELNDINVSLDNILYH